MKVVALLSLLVLASASVAKEYEWKDSTVIDISSERAGAAAMPVGTGAIAFPIMATFYRIRINADGMVYVARAIGRSQLLNVTVNGHNGFRIDEHGHVHILDDAGKDRKLNIVEKIAPKSD
jgi:hypothetical protein